MGALPTDAVQGVMKEKLRILVLTDELYPDAIGGVGKSVSNLARAWVQQGHHVTVVVRRTRPQLPASDTLDGIEIVRFSGPPRSHPAYRLYPLHIVWHVSRWLARHRQEFDVIFINNALYLLPIEIAGGHRPAPIAYNIHAPLLLEINIGADHGQYGNLAFVARLMGRIFHVVESRALQKSDHIIVDGQRMLDDLRKLHGPRRFHEKTSVLDLGVDVQAYVPRDQAAARESLGLPSDHPILLSVRRLVGRVGLTNLVDAMLHVSQKHPDVLLLIAGKGFLREALEEQIEALDLAGNVRLLGFVEEELLPHYLSAADLFVLPTEFLEGFGLATIEALACGLPVVGTPVGTTPEILGPIEARLLTGDTTPDSIASTITYWLDRPGELKSLREVCRQTAEERYDAHKIASQLADLFQSLHAQRRGVPER